MRESIEIICPNCGRLGIFYLSPEQHRAGALARAERLADKHVHRGEPCEHPGVDIVENNS